RREGQRRARDRTVAREDHRTDPQLRLRAVALRPPVSCRGCVAYRAAHGGKGAQSRGERRALSRARADSALPGPRRPRPRQLLEALPHADLARGALLVVDDLAPPSLSANGQLWGQAPGRRAVVPVPLSGRPARARRELCRIALRRLNTKSRRSTMIRNSVYFFTLLALFAIAAFWPSYLSRATSIPEVRVHLHGAVMALWVAMLITQAFLIRNGARPTHRLIGKASYVLAPLIVLSTLALAHLRLHEAGDEPPVDLLYFVYVQLAMLSLFVLA